VDGPATAAGVGRFAEAAGAEGSEPPVGPTEGLSSPRAVNASVEAANAATTAYPRRRILEEPVNAERSEVADDPEVSNLALYMPRGLG
jgi:hypothetical protein